MGRLKTLETDVSGGCGHVLLSAVGVSSSSLLSSSLSRSSSSSSSLTAAAAAAIGRHIDSVIREDRLSDYSLCGPHYIWRLLEGAAHSFQRWNLFIFVLSNIKLLLVIWEFHIMHPNHIHYSVFPGPTPSLVTCPKGREKKKKKTKRKKKIPSPICVAHIIIGTWLNSQRSDP